MLRPGKRRLAPACLLALIALFATACHARSEEASITAPLPDGEPESYSATVVRTFEEGDRKEVVVTRVARSGGMLREEWTEAGERRALIYRPDLGKSFLLSLDRRTCSESAIIDEKHEARSDEASDAADPQRIERAIGASPPAARVERRSLPDCEIDGHICQVTETRAYFEGGREEVTRVFRARGLAGLAVRVESETRAPGVTTRVVTERRDIVTRVAEGEFQVPADFVRQD